MEGDKGAPKDVTTRAATTESLRFMVDFPSESKSLIYIINADSSTYRKKVNGAADPPYSSNADTPVLHGRYCAMLQPMTAFALPLSMIGIVRSGAEGYKVEEVAGPPDSLIRARWNLRQATRSSGLEARS